METGQPILILAIVSDWAPIACVSRPSAEGKCSDVLEGKRVNLLVFPDAYAAEMDPAAAGLF